MHPRQTLPAAASQLAQAQAGILSHNYLVGLGMTPTVIRRLAADWDRLGRGLYCLQRPTWDSAVWAGLFHAGPSGTAGGLAAAHLHGWEPAEPADVTIWSTRSLKALPVGQWRVNFRIGERRGRGDPTRSLPEDTILDAAHETTPDGIVHLLSRALSQRSTTVPRLLDALGTRTRQRHSRLIRAACMHGMDGIESILEWRYSREVEAAHGLPRPMRQVELSVFSREDIYYRDYGVVIHLDGRLGHEAPHRDRRRDNRHAIHHGVITLRYGWHEVIADPCGVAAEIARCLRARGWDGEPLRCRRCRRVR